MGVIVVGVDGSEPSKHALRWATEEARLRDATIKAVHVWQYPVEGTWAGVPLDFYDAMERGAAEILHATVAEVAGDDSSKIERVAVCGAPALTLVDVSVGAELLVVGSRGLGGFKGLLLGSVSQQCVHHATCPVVVIPIERDGES
jgi:nucleotide-binding universal stress UspA family protein